MEALTAFRGIPSELPSPTKLLSSSTGIDTLLEGGPAEVLARSDPEGGGESVGNSMYSLPSFLVLFFPPLPFPFLVVDGDEEDGEGGGVVTAKTMTEGGVKTWSKPLWSGSKLMI